MPLFGKLKVFFFNFKNFKILFSTQNNKLSKKYNYTAIINIFSPFENTVQTIFLKNLNFFC
jgi:hypothetical protein